MYCILQNERTNPIPFYRGCSSTAILSNVLQLLLFDEKSSHSFSLVGLLCDVQTLVNHIVCSFGHRVAVKVTTEQLAVIVQFERPTEIITTRFIEIIMIIRSSLFKY